MHPEKANAKVVDFDDINADYFQDHFMERMKFYVSEPEFTLEYDGGDPKIVSLVKREGTADERDAAVIEESPADVRGPIRSEWHLAGAAEIDAAQHERAAVLIHETVPSHSHHPAPDL